MKVKEKKVELIELFYDLIYVYARRGSGLNENCCFDGKSE